MYCPTCSTQAVEGAKFCKTCGMNLGIVTQALTGSLVVSDPLRDREFKRARKQISDGIHGSAVGTAFLAVGALIYFLLPRQTWLYVVCVSLALIGVVKLFRSIGSIIDANIGPKLVDPGLQPRSTGSLSGGSPALAAPTTTTIRPSQRLALDQTRAGATPPPTRPLSIDANPTPQSNAPPAAPPPRIGTGRINAPPAEPPPRIGTGRINREHSTPLGRLNREREDDLMSKLRN